MTNHTLRRTFAALLYEAGASPAYVMSQMGHTSAGRGKDGKVQRSFAFAQPFGRRSPFAQPMLLERTRTLSHEQRATAPTRGKSRGREHTQSAGMTPEDVRLVVAGGDEFSVVWRSLPA